MRTLSRFLLFGIALCLAAAVAGLLTDKHLQAATATSTNNIVPVSVTNTPLPVQGSVSVSGNVGISGTPTVSVGNTPTVSLATGSAVAVSNETGTLGALPLLVRNADEGPHRWNTQCSINSSGTGSPSCSLGTVPSGQRLIVRSVTGTFELSTDAVLRQLFLEPEAYTLTASMLPLSLQTGTTCGASACDVEAITIAQPGELIFEPGDAIVFHFFTGNGPALLFGSIHLNGYLVPAQ